MSGELVFADNQNSENGNASYRSSFISAGNQREVSIAYLHSGIVVAKYSRSMIKLKTWRFRRLKVTTHDFLDWQTNQLHLRSLVGIQVGKMPVHLKNEPKELVCVKLYGLV